MKNNNLPFNPAEFVNLSFTIKKFLIFGKPTSELRQYYSGKWKFIGPKLYAKELADRKRAAEDAQLTAVVSETAGNEMRLKVLDAALRISPNLKNAARKIRVIKTAEIVRLTGEAEVIAVKKDEAEKAKAAAELLLE